MKLNPRIPSMTEAPGPAARSDANQREPEVLHALRNHLAVVVSFAGLLLEELADTDPHRNDVVEIHRSAVAAMEVLPQIAALARAGRNETR